VDLIAEMRFGSHLYGTDTPESDADLKGVYVSRRQETLFSSACGPASILVQGLMQMAGLDNWLPIRTHDDEA